MVGDTIRSSPSSQSSVKSKRRSIFNIFGQRGSSNSEKSRRSSMSSDHASNLHDVEEDDSSDDDKSIDLTSYQAAIAPLRFRSFRPKKHNDENADLSERVQMMLDDEDYEKYLRQPKHLKTFRKSHKTAPIFKRLFLAQELNQDFNPQLPPVEIDELDDLDLRTETANTTNGNTSYPDLLSGVMKDPSDKSSEKKNAIWAMKFSLNGKYLASAGKGNVITIWKVIASPLDRFEFTATHTDDPTANGDTTENTFGDMDDRKMAYASVFQDQPYRSYYGHTHDILSLDWSKNNFLLSSSMDKTVKLWNIQQTHCLRTFQHRDFVPSVKFHPTDDRFFVSGCLDHKVRLWSILEGEAKFEFDAGNLVTAVAFTPAGSIIIAGTFNGMVYFLDTQTLDLRHSLELNQKKHENMKITGIECFNDGDDVKVVITSNDSRIRVLSLKNKQLEYYLKGLDNNSSQIIATVSSDNKYIISGSENHWLYIWEVHKDSDRHSSVSSTYNDNGNNHGLLSLIKNKKKKKRADYTSFHAHHHVITCALVAPPGTSKALSLSNDYIYELNSELSNYTYMESEDGGHCKIHNNKSSALINNDSIGGIIVTADDHGLIRVFRQDLPSAIRKTLLNEKKRRDIQKETQQLELQAHRTSILNKAFNGSSTSLLSRGNSTRSVTNRGSEVSPDRTPLQERSRSGTLESTAQRLRQAQNGQQKKITCDVCGGDKFGVSKNTTGLDVFCTDCGNQIKP